jgi:hypothetical protein
MGKKAILFGLKRGGGGRLSHHNDRPKEAPPREIGRPPPWGKGLGGRGDASRIGSVTKNGVVECRQSFLGTGDSTNFLEISVT